jgi:molecular chaperone GrpE
MSKDKKVKNQKASKEELEQKMGEYMSGWQRAQADYQNLQKETKQWKAEFVQYAKVEFILELLPVYSHYKIALEHVPAEEKDKDWVQGLQHIFQQIKTMLDKFHVVEMKTVGEKVDYNLHEAVGDETDKEKENDTILKEMQPGYMLKDKVLQPAKVIVNKLDIKKD